MLERIDPKTNGIGTFRSSNGREYVIDGNAKDGAMVLGEIRIAESSKCWLYARIPDDERDAISREYREVLAQNKKAF